MSKQSPIVIYVSNNDWSAAPLKGNILSDWDRFLISEIKLAGGIDSSVPPGVYHFNILLDYLGNETVILVPAREKNSH